jgi:hypothetical protein
MVFPESNTGIQQQMKKAQETLWKDHCQVFPPGEYSVISGI